MPEISYREAMTRALRETLREEERAFIIGEDIGPYGGSYAVTSGFLDEFGPDRIVESPISESGIVGIGTGSAMVGLRPIVEIMTINFSLLALDQIVNHAAKIRYMSGGQFSVPVIIRTVTGGGAALAATHSQNLEGWYASVPGLKVVIPATPHDALGLFRSVRKEQDPVMFIEHILLYSTRGEVPEDYYEVPVGKANLKRAGKDFTIIAYSRMVNVALRAAEKLAEEGVDVEVVDLRSLRPWDKETVLESVKRTGRALVLEEAWQTGAFGGEIASTVQREVFDYLDGPVARLGGIDVPTPYSMSLEPLVAPREDSVIKTVREELGS